MKHSSKLKPSQLSGSGQKDSMNKTAQSPAEKERYAADRAAHRLAKMYQKAGYHVHDESEADERESVMSHMLRDPHWRDLGTHQKCYGVPDEVMTQQLA